MEKQIPSLIKYFLRITIESREAVTKRCSEKKVKSPKRTVLMESYFGKTPYLRAALLP